MGFNLVDTPDPVPMRKRYGWDTFSGNAALRLLALPFDPAKSRRDFEDIYRDLRDPALREYYEGVPVFQMVDEPYELKRDEMSSPLWRYEAKGGEPAWIDYPGSSELHTRDTNLTDCVLEGMIEKRGAMIEFRVATDNAGKPSRFAYWRVGTVLPDNNPANLLTGKRGMGDTPVQDFVRPRPTSPRGRRPSRSSTRRATRPSSSTTRFSPSTTGFRRRAGSGSRATPRPSGRCGSVHWAPGTASRRPATASGRCPWRRRRTRRTTR
jgi:hypothetical protein